MTNPVDKTPTEPDIPPEIREIDERARKARRRLLSALVPRATRAQLATAALCAVLGFALVVQVRQANIDPLGSLRQAELVRLLDDVTTQSADLARTERALRTTRDDLLSGTDRARVALESTTERLTTQAILAGTVPVSGPGVTVSILDRDGTVDALALLEVLQELRNSGAEAVELNGARISTGTWFLDTPDGILMDHKPIAAPYLFVAIGDPQTISAALEMPGGVLAGIRGRGASAYLESDNDQVITSVRKPTMPKYATPSQSPSPSP